MVSKRKKHHQRKIQARLNPSFSGIWFLSWKNGIFSIQGLSLNPSFSGILVLSEVEAWFLFANIKI